MITIEDIEYEPDQTKLFWMDKKIILMLAGDMRLHASVIPATKLSLDTDRPSKLTVEIVAKRLAKHFAEYRRYINEQKYLVPLGIRDARDFLVRQRDMSPAEVADLRRKMQETWIDAPAIVAGIDEIGPRIFKVEDPGIATSYDSTCFCAIGIGAAHAESQFMMAEYRSGWHFVSALFLAYSAKVRAQAASNVGVKTDVFYISELGGYQLIPDDMDFLRSLYLEKEQAIRAANEVAYAGIWDRITKETQKQASQSPPDQQSSEGPPNAGIITHDPELEENEADDTEDSEVPEHG